MCDDGYHTTCLKPKLKSIPNGEWFCVACKPAVTAPVRRLRRKEESDNEASSVEEDASELKSKTKKAPVKKASIPPPVSKVSKGGKRSRTPVEEENTDSDKESDGTPPSPLTPLNALPPSPLTPRSRERERGCMQSMQARRRLDLLRALPARAPSGLLSPTITAGPSRRMEMRGVRKKHGGSSAQANN